MAKPRRAHAPGCIFHITARTQGHHPWFTDSIRERIADEIIASARMAGMCLLAYAVMPNHFHILIRQSESPLGEMMHRVMHRAAIWIRKAHDVQGHVFERRYYSGLCRTADHVRAAIVYTHLNPLRGALCSDPAEYRWSSHAIYLAIGQRQPLEDSTFKEGLRFFLRHSNADDAGKQYIDHVNFQLNVDAHLAGSLKSSRLVAPATCEGGDLHWVQRYEHALASVQTKLEKRPLYDVALTLLAQLDPKCPLDLLRSGTRARKIVDLRKNMVAALLTKGYRGVDIARFLGLSTNAVSKVAVSLRA